MDFTQGLRVTLLEIQERLERSSLSNSTEPKTPKTDLILYQSSSMIINTAEDGKPNIRVTRKITMKELEEDLNRLPEDLHKLVSKEVVPRVLNSQTPTEVKIPTSGNQGKRLESISSKGRGK